MPNSQATTLRVRPEPIGLAVRAETSTAHA